MNFWLLLWLFLALGLMGFLLWTFLILQRQKRAWKVFAKKRKFRYKAGPLLASPQMEGTVGQHTVSLFTGEHVSENARGARKLTAIEVSLNSVMPIAGGVASGGMVPILKTMNLKQEYRPAHESWNESYMAAAQHRKVLEVYLTPERLEALLGLMQVKHGWVILVFRDEAMLLRIDTPYPLDNPSKVDELIKQMIEAAKVLELKPGEEKVLKSEAVKRVAQDVELDVDDSTLDAPVGLELDDDEGDDDVEASQDSEPSSTKNS